MPLGEGEERKVTARKWRRRVGDDRAQPRDTPTGSHQRRSGRMLPALQFGDPERHDVGIVADRAAAVQQSQEQPVDLRERVLDARSVGPARERRRLPCEPVESELLPHALKLPWVVGDEQSFQCSGELTEFRDGGHTQKVRPPGRFDYESASRRRIVHIDLENRVEIFVNALGNVALPPEPA